MGEETKVFFLGSPCEKARIGTPYLVYVPSMQILDLPSEYLRSGTRCFNSRRATAYILARWSRFLSERRCEWMEASASDLLAYVLALESTTSLRGSAACRPATVTAHTQAVQGFYAFASQRGYAGDLHCQTAGVPRSWRPPRTTEPRFSGLRHAGTLRMALPSVRVAKILDATAWKALMAALGPLPSESAFPGKCRDRLIIEILLQSGLRLNELTSLQTRDFDVDVSGALHSHHAISILRKGGRQLFVNFPNWLILEIKAYVKARGRASSTQYSD